MGASRPVEATKEYDVDFPALLQQTGNPVSDTVVSNSCSALEVEDVSTDDWDSEAEIGESNFSEYDELEEAPMLDMSLMFNGCCVE